MDYGVARIIIVRHGETEWNRVDRFRGRADLRLNERGLRQAELVARRIADSWKIAAVYSSPLHRAVQTAMPIASLSGLAVQTAQDLIDLDYGAWEGLTPGEVAERFPALHELWLRSPQRVAMPGGESLADVRGRVEALLGRIATDYRDDAVVVVAHKVVCKMLVLAVLGIADDYFWQIEQDNAALTIADLAGERRVLVRCNDTCHLNMETWLHVEVR